VDVWLIVLIALLAFFILMPLVGIGRMAWRIFRHDEEPQPGGSLGRQMFGRRKDP
jgi:hypothetical protein